MKFGNMIVLYYWYRSKGLKNKDLELRNSFIEEKYNILKICNTM